MSSEMARGHGLNLTTHRAPVSVWERRGWNGMPEQLALSRWLIGIGGAALAIQAMRQRTKTGGALAGLGGGLAWWALAGTGDLAAVRQWFTGVVEPLFRREDVVHQTSSDSFPASDAPSWTPAVGTGVRREPRTPSC
jgi:hypothetical protein